MTIIVNISALLGFMPYNKCKFVWVSNSLGYPGNRGNSNHSYIVRIKHVKPDFSVLSVTFSSGLILNDMMTFRDQGQSHACIDDLNKVNVIKICVCTLSVVNYRLQLSC